MTTSRLIHFAEAEKTIADNSDQQMCYTIKECFRVTTSIIYDAKTKTFESKPVKFSAPN